MLFLQKSALLKKLNRQTFLHNTLYPNLNHTKTSHSHCGWGCHNYLAYLPKHAHTLVCMCALSTGKCVPGRHPFFAGQLSVWGGGVGGVCRVRSVLAKHQTLPPLPHAVHNTRHFGLQRPWECLLHGAAQWWVDSSGTRLFPAFSTFIPLYYMYLVTNTCDCFVILHIIFSGLTWLSLIMQSVSVRLSAKTYVGKRERSGLYFKYSRSDQNCIAEF